MLLELGQLKLLLWMSKCDFNHSIRSSSSSKDRGSIVVV